MLETLLNDAGYELHKQPGGPVRIVYVDRPGGPDRPGLLIPSPRSPRNPLKHGRLAKNTLPTDPS